AGADARVEDDAPRGDLELQVRGVDVEAHAVPPQSTHPAPRGSASATHVPAATSRCWLRPAFAAPRRSASASLAASAPTASAREAAVGRQLGKLGRTVQ